MLIMAIINLFIHCIVQFLTAHFFFRIFIGLSVMSCLEWCLDLIPYGLFIH